MLIGAGWPASAVSALYLVLLAALIAFLAREITTGRKWRKLPVPGLMALFAVANGLFHIEAAFGPALNGYGLRLALATVLMLIALIGGLIVPRARNSLEEGVSDLCC